MAKIRYKHRWRYMLIPLFFWLVPYAITYRYIRLKETWKATFVFITTGVILVAQSEIAKVVSEVLSVADTNHNTIITLFVLYASGTPWTFYLIKKYELYRDGCDE